MNRIISTVRSKARYVLVMILAMGVSWFWFSLPRPLFDDPTAMVIEDRDGHLLSARIAADEQWRFPAQDSVAYRFEASIINFEDRRFYKHVGVDPWLWPGQSGKTCKSAGL